MLGFRGQEAGIVEVEDEVVVVVLLVVGEEGRGVEGEAKWIR